MGVLFYGSGHGRLRPSLRAFHALLSKGLLASEWGGGGLNTLLNSRKSTLNLGAGGGGTQEGMEARSRPPHHHRALKRPAQHDQH